MRYILIAVCWLLLTPGILAQTGIKIGINASTFKYVNIPDPYQQYDVDLRPYLGYDIEWVQLAPQKPIYSPLIGLQQTIKIYKRISLRPELYFLTKGVNFSRNEFEKIIYKLRINYLELPLSVVCNYLETSSLIGDLYLGGYVAIKLNAVKKTAWYHASVLSTQVDNIHDFEGGIQVGGNLKYRFANHSIFFGYRISFGLTNLLYLPENQVRMYDTLNEVNHVGINLYVGYEI